MTYSSGAQIIEFDAVGGAGRVTVILSNLDISDDAIDDVGTIICAIPLQVYGVGMYITETLGTQVDEDMVLEMSLIVGGTDRTIAAVDIDAVTLRSGDASQIIASATASGGSESLLVGDVIWGNSTVFPILVPAGSVLTFRATDNGALAGEAIPFVYAKWMGMDFRANETWVNQA